MQVRIHPLSVDAVREVTQKAFDDFISTTSTAHDLTCQEAKQVEFLQTSSD
jgi:hypothetical protein